MWKKQNTFKTGGTSFFPLYFWSYHKPDWIAVDEAVVTWHEYSRFVTPTRYDSWIQQVYKLMTSPSPGQCHSNGMASPIIVFTSFLTFTAEFLPLKGTSDFKLHLLSFLPLHVVVYLALHHTHHQPGSLHPTISILLGSNHDKTAFLPFQYPRFNLLDSASLQTLTSIKTLPKFVSATTHHASLLLPRVCRYYGFPLLRHGCHRRGSSQPEP